MFSTLLLLCAFIIILYYSLQFAKFYRLINNIPGLPPIPVFGTLEAYNCSQENLWKIMRLVGKCYYPIYKVWIGPFAFVSIQHPNDLEKILSNPKEHLSKGFIYSVLQPWLGTGLLTSEGIIKLDEILNSNINIVRNRIGIKGYTYVRRFL